MLTAVYVHSQACGVGSSLETTPCCTYSYAATPGWDASTGLGSPNFQVIANLVLNNQTYFPSTAAYPNGVSSTQSVYETIDYSDDDTDAHATAGLALGATGLGIAIFSLVGVCLLWGRGGGGSSMANPLMK